MNRTKRFSGIIPILLFLLSSLVLKAQMPAEFDTKMKYDNMRNFQVEEIKVRWKKSALENCPGVPCVTPALQVCPTLLVTDGDGNLYNTINIGTQCWTKENLKATKYNDGITIIPDETANAGWGMLSTGARTEYVAAGVTGYVPTYGYLYNWYAAAGITSTVGISTKNICPSGWHVPTDADWTTLIQYLDNMATGSLPNSGNQSISAGIKLKATNLWNSPLNTNNSSGFSALPGGYRDSGGNFSNIGGHAYFWTTTVNNYNSLNNHAWNRDLNDNLIVYRTFYPMKVGFSIRCLKD
jgi:uncharacterized protein (TIGR02145 family)